MNLIFIHGGAGKIPKDKLNEVSVEINKAIHRGIDILRKGGSSIAAVIAAISYMEDSGIFNAGRGSALTIDKRVEFDAAIATSKGDFGAVAAVPNVRNPIKLAYDVMVKTKHKLLAGDGAKKFAEKLGYDEYSKDELVGFKRYDEIREKLSKYYSLISEMYNHHKIIWGDTVGAIAVDSTGLIAVGVSTGGLWMKLPGRIGDSPIFGSGLYVSPIGGAVATGVGEIILLSNISFRVIEGIKGSNLYASGKSAIRYVNNVFGKGNTGFIAVTKFGEAIRIHNTEYLSSAIWWDDLEEPLIELSGDKHYIIHIKKNV